MVLLLLLIMDDIISQNTRLNFHLDGGWVESTIIRIYSQSSFFVHSVYVDPVFANSPSHLKSILNPQINTCCTFVVIRGHAQCDEHLRSLNQCIPK